MDGGVTDRVEASSAFPQRCGRSRDAGGGGIRCSMTMATGFDVELMGLALGDI